MSILGLNMYILGPYMYILGVNMYILGSLGTKVYLLKRPLGTKVYLLKRYSPSDSFCTFFSESVEIEKHMVTFSYTLSQDTYTRNVDSTQVNTLQ